MFLFDSYFDGTNFVTCHPFQCGDKTFVAFAGRFSCYYRNICFPVPHCTHRSYKVRRPEILKKIFNGSKIFETLLHWLHKQHPFVALHVNKANIDGNFKGARAALGDVNRCGCMFTDPIWRQNIKD